jgi:hypothetical protein
MTTTSSRLNSPAVPMAATIPLTVGFVVLRFLHAGDHRLSSFVLAGSRFTNKANAPKGLPIRGGAGYDGQFYYRLALNPFNLARTSYGIRFDAMSRVERIGYPFVAWALSLGDHARVPLTLVVANVLAAAVLGLAGGLLATSSGRHALWGLVFPLYWGYLWTIGRDLSELTTAALVILALAALARRHPVWAGLAFLGAILSKETAVLLVGTLAVGAVWVRWRGNASTSPTLSAPAPGGGGITLAPRRADLAYLIPLVGFVVWQSVLWRATGKLPILESGGENLGPPFVGLFHGIAHYVSAFPDVGATIWLGELAVIAIVGVVTVRSRGGTPLELQMLWVVSVALGICAAAGVWLGDVGFRSLDDIYLLSWVLLLIHPGRLVPWAALCLGAWVVVAVELIRYI